MLEKRLSMSRIEAIKKNKTKEDWFKEQLRNKRN